MAKYGALAVISAFLLLSGATLLLSTSATGSDALNNLRGARRLDGTVPAAGAPKQDPMTQALNALFTMAGWFVWGAFFYVMVASKYPEVKPPSERSVHSIERTKEVLDESPCFRINPGCKCMLSWCCMPIQWAHVMKGAGGMNYWVALLLGVIPTIAQFFFCYAYMFSDLVTNLGGKKKAPVSACLEVWCCGCCTVHQMVDAMDAATGVETECCGVKKEGDESGSGSE